jgi:hypothetical protein
MQIHLNLHLSYSFFCILLNYYYYYYYYYYITNLLPVIHFIFGTYPRQ